MTTMKRESKLSITSMIMDQIESQVLLTVNHKKFPNKKYIYLNKCGGDIIIIYSKRFLDFENYPVLQGKWLLLSMVIIINSEICGLS